MALPACRRIPVLETNGGGFWPIAALDAAAPQALEPAFNGFAQRLRDEMQGCELWLPKSQLWSAPRPLRIDEGAPSRWLSNTPYERGAEPSGVHGVPRQSSGPIALGARDQM